MKLVTMRTRWILFFLLISGLIQAQDVTGIWRGHFRSNDNIYQRLMADDDRYRIEVQIAQHDKTLKAVTYSYRSTIFYGKAEANGSVDFKTKKVLLRELKIVELRMMGGDACIMTCYLQYAKLGDEEFLEGTYTSRNTRDSSDCGKGTIFLHKVVESDFYKEPFLEKKEQEKATEKKKLATPPPAPSPDNKLKTDSAVAKKTLKTGTTAPKTTTLAKTAATNKTTTTKKTIPSTNVPATKKPATTQTQTAKTQSKTTPQKAPV
ncbi:MAG TPA: hypothetical protein VMH01_08415, partial [Puia sp.]|nr:hypothetical protein [Puia sp.]